MARVPLWDPYDPFGLAAPRRVLIGLALALVITAVVRHFRDSGGEALFVALGVAVFVVTVLLEPVLRALQRLRRAPRQPFKRDPRGARLGP